MLGPVLISDIKMKSIKESGDNMIRLRLTSAAKSQANPFAKNRKPKDLPNFVDSFTSSNIDAVAYDPEKKQMWVRFKGKDVYTYFDVPIQIYRGFWSSPSKGHYFWEKIRKNPHIQYQKLTASIHWKTLKASAQQANIAAIMKSFRKKAKQHPNWGEPGLLENTFNGKRLVFPGFIVDTVGYGNKVRVNLYDPTEGLLDFSTTADKETSDVVSFLTERVERFLTKYPELTTQCIQAARDNNTIVQTVRPALVQLCKHLNEAIPEELWSVLDLVTPGTYPQIKGEHYRLDVVDATETEYTVNLTDRWTNKVDTNHYLADSFVADCLSDILIKALQG